MRIIFVENRALTSIWAAIAEKLILKGHEIHWIVQNRVFSPKVGIKHYLKNFRVDSVDCSDMERYTSLRSADRGIYYNGGDDKHYFQHDHRIGDIFDAIKPDFIFGECTQYHEILSIYNAKDRDIPYLVPFPSRYPINRTFFYLYDSFQAIGGSNELLECEELELAVDNVSKREVVLPYMEIKKTYIFLKNLYFFRLLIGWIISDRHITPSPVRRISNRIFHHKMFRLWENLAFKKLAPDLNFKKIVLYPMQMQPESNIDVYGQPWNDQNDIISRMSRVLESKNCILVVKPNPKSKYELNESLLSLVASRQNIVALSHTVKMSSVINKVDLVVTVTGTVLLECVFSKIRIACLGNHQMSRYPGVEVLSKPDDVANILFDESPSFASRQQIENLYSELYKQSYQGVIFDPISDPHLMTEDNISLLVKAFESVMAVK